ncbi:MAG: hypothetical protein JNL79_16065 [Myxococcales bacterium]|nr:hypothetical protein [Myxococcales bacterium]
MPRPRLGAATAVALVAVLLAGRVDAGSLDKFEKPHKAPAPSSDEDSSKKKSSSSSSSYSSTSPSSSSGSGSDGTLAALFWCTVIVPILGACAAPYHRPVVDPYSPDPKPWAPDEPAPRRPELQYRHWEAHVGGFVASNEAVFARTMALRGYAGPMVFSAAWDRMYETPAPGELARLDLVRFGVSSNPVGDATQRVEIYPWMGALLMRGTENHWAFDLGLELRIYPASPLSIRASSFASIFRYGPVLFDTRLELGVSFDRFELHGGLRWLTQAKEQGFAGPTAGLTVRL